MTATNIPRRLVKLPEVMSFLALRATSVYQQEKNGLLPPRIKLTPRSSAWVLDELAEVNAARIAGRTDGEIRSLVQELVAARSEARPIENTTQPARGQPQEHAAKRRRMKRDRASLSTK